MPPCFLRRGGFTQKHRCADLLITLMDDHISLICYHLTEQLCEHVGCMGLCGKTCVPVVSKEGAVLSVFARARLPVCYPLLSPFISDR